MELNIKIGARKIFGFPKLKSSKNETIWKATIQKINRSNSKIYFEMDFVIPNNTMDQKTGHDILEKIKKNIPSELLFYKIITWEYGSDDNGMWYQRFLHKIE